MKLTAMCFQCGMENPGSAVCIYGQFVVRDDGIYRFTCAASHDNFVLLTNPKYEVLFEVGMNALVDDYYREAISSFAAALERFYEFATNVVWMGMGADQTVRDAAWAPMKSSSERQLGAFIGAFTTALKKPPTVLPEKLVKLRNDVVHKGKIPTLEEAIQFGNEAKKVIFLALQELKITFKTALNEYPFQELTQRHEQRPEGVRVSSMNVYSSLGSQIDSSLNPGEQASIADHLPNVIRAREMFSQNGG